MSRTTKGSKAPGYEYWGRRPMKQAPPSPKNKTLTHRKERRKANKDIREEEI